MSAKDGDIMEALMVRGMLTAGCLALLAVGTSACLAHKSSTMDDEVMSMITKMGVPGASAKPDKLAMTLDCPPVRSMLERARQLSASLSPMFKEMLNAWAQWYRLPKLT